ncbi:hypothetical protein BHE74_00030792 [Ensete ventricosum]|nr:hypothetical protein GW17_00002390 [Ensete ventricosum]RWW62100.1 hypothetical protein BHE74_00030792 [Ensete ventricosum]
MGGMYWSARLTVRGPAATGRYCQNRPSAVDFSHRRLISTIGDRLREKLTINGRLREKKGRRRRGKEERRKKKKRRRIEKYLLARGRFFSHARRWNISLHGEKDRGDIASLRRLVLLRGEGGIASSCVGTRRRLALFVLRGEGGVASSRVGTWRRLTSFIPRGPRRNVAETSDLTVPTGRSVYRYPVGPVESGDLIAYGLVPEFVGRFPVLIPDVNTEGKDEPIDAVVVDEDAVGSVDRPGSGAKILRGDGALERYITGSKIKDHPVSEGVEVESEGESEDASRALGL